MDFRKADRFLYLTFWAATAVLITRLFETVFGTHLLNNLLGACFDIAYLAAVSAVLLFVYLFFAKFSEKTTLLVFRILYSIVSLVAMLLVSYFAQTGAPLDRVFFVYSLNEIIEIISTSQTTEWWMYLCIAFVPCYLFLISGKKLKFNKISGLIAVVTVAICIVVRIVFYDSSIKNTGYYEQSNKILYFLRSLNQDEKLEYGEEIPMDVLSRFRGYFSENEFVSAEYPFLSKDKCNDVIGGFFDLSDEKPNIVMVIVEGLGRENSGKYSKYMSSTLYLDSLAEHSLYWLNCFSTSQRTAGVMPALLGSLPMGRDGFMAYKRNAPNFNSLPKILNENGYSFSFYYGGKSSFDNMNDFILLNGGDPDFSDQYDDAEERGEWGLYDDFLFAEAVKHVDFQSEKPRFDLYLTLTSHAPWIYPDKQEYINKYLEMSAKSEKKPYKDAIMAAVYLYVDDAIRQLIADYSKHEGFENTIFIITGDHNFYNVPFEKYHVPLMIWSPMLKQSKYFPAIVSHRDFTPTLISMLSKKYSITKPDEMAWLNPPLDTTSVFGGKSFSPQMDASRNLVNMVWHDFFVDNNDVYKIVNKNNQLDLEPATDSIDEVLDLFNIYKAFDKYVCDNDKLIDIGEDNDFKWVDYTNLNKIPTDTLVTEGMYPLELINMMLDPDYDALRLHFGFDMVIDEKTAQEGLSLGVLTEIRDEKGSLVYSGTNDIRSFKELFKKYEYTEILKNSNYNFKKGQTLRVFLVNWNYSMIKLANINNSVKIGVIE